MTVDTTSTLPVHSEMITSSDPDQLEKYMRELVSSLERQYERLAQGINGTIRYSTSSQDGLIWTPAVKGTTGAGTATYSIQVGWAVRTGLMVDAFFHVQWTGHTGTGNLYVELPYIVSKPLSGSGLTIFVGSCITGGITFTGGRTAVSLIAVSDSYQCELWEYGSALTSINIIVPATGSLQGSIRYIGQQDE